MLGRIRRTGAVAYRLKQEGKAVTYNDILRFNYQFGLALIENSETKLAPEEIEWLLTRHKEISYPTFVQETFQIFIYRWRKRWIDQMITNIRQLSDPTNSL